MLYGIWLVGAVFLNIHYNTIFFSTLTIPRYASQIDTLDDLSHVAQTDSYNVVLVRGNSFGPRFLHADPENKLYSLIGKHMNRTSLPKFLPHIREAIPSLERDSKLLLIHTRTTLALQRHMLATKQLHNTSENIGPDYSSMIFPKRSPLRAPFDMV